MLCKRNNQNTRKSTLKLKIGLQNNNRLRWWSWRNLPNTDLKSLKQMQNMTEKTKDIEVCYPNNRNSKKKRKS